MSRRATSAHDHPRCNLIRTVGHCTCVQERRTLPPRCPGRDRDEPGRADALDGAGARSACAESPQSAAVSSAALAMPDCNGHRRSPLLPSVWGLSPTFKHQCRRLAAARVVVVVQWADDLTPAHHAETRIMFDGGRVFRAVVRLRASDEPAVYFIHELEHVMEALDGIDHRSPRSAMEAWGGGYETARARRVEAWARRELVPLASGMSLREGHQ